MSYLTFSAVLNRHLSSVKSVADFHRQVIMRAEHTTLKGR